MYRNRDPYCEPRQPRLLASITGDLELVTPATGQAVSTGRAKKYLRVDAADDDDQIGELIEAATVFCEQEIEGARQIRPATFDLPVLCWWQRPLKLPRPPLSAVVSVRHFDTAGAEQTLASSVYLVRTPWRQPGTIERAPDQTWPAYQQDRRLPITIRFTAGYAVGSVPRTVEQAILLLVSQWYEQRMPIGQVTQETANAVAALLASEGWGSYA